MKSGEAAIFFKSGDWIIDKVLDISSERLVLETEKSGEFPLRDIWMINFIDEGWDFPRRGTGSQPRITTSSCATRAFPRAGSSISAPTAAFSSSRAGRKFRSARSAGSISPRTSPARSRPGAGKQQASKSSARAVGGHLRPHGALDCPDHPAGRPHGPDDDRYRRSPGNGL